MRPSGGADKPLQLGALALKVSRLAEWRERLTDLGRKGCKQVIGPPSKLLGTEEAQVLDPGPPCEPPAVMGGESDGVAVDRHRPVGEERHAEAVEPGPRRRRVHTEERALAPPEPGGPLGPAGADEGTRRPKHVFPAPRAPLRRPRGEPVRRRVQPVSPGARGGRDEGGPSKPSSRAASRSASARGWPASASRIAARSSYASRSGTGSGRDAGSSGAAIAASASGREEGAGNSPAPIRTASRRVSRKSVIATPLLEPRDRRDQRDRVDFARFFRSPCKGTKGGQRHRQRRAVPLVPAWPRHGGRAKPLFLRRGPLGPCGPRRFRGTGGAGAGDRETISHRPPP